ncbi:MAG: hypothetical protein KDA93_08615 [Planctomycetaceae bacterium]|nr:hypothetical protein [Planctomycetaceae bacterium]
MSSCSGGGPQPPTDKEVVPVTGKVTLDGEPATSVVVKFYPKSSINDPDPNSFQGGVDEQGNLFAGTYANNDGLAPGEYMVTFEKYDTSNIIIGQKPADLLKQKYWDPTKSEFSVNVQSGQASADMGTIELTSPE